MNNRSSVAEPLLLVSIDLKVKETQERLCLHTKNLRKVFLDPRVADSQLMIISINGAMRTGKSFLINLCIKYLKNQENNFETFKETPVNGYNWGPLEENETVGIWIWSEPILIKSPRNGLISVLFIDSQGEFGKKISIKETMKMYAFSQLISSLHLFNVDTQMNENYLSWLTLFTNFTTISALDLEKETGSKNFRLHQSLLFVIRDWPYPYKFNYGIEGGKQYIEKFLSTEGDSIDAELRNTRKYLKSHYKDINCFLMPFIGNVGATSENFNGTWETLSVEFQESVWNFLETMFSSKFLIIKEMYNKTLIGREMIVFTENCFKAITSLDNPTPLNIFDACSETNYHNILLGCCKYYSESMNRRNLSRESIERRQIFHEQYKAESLQKFDDTPKFGNKKYFEKFRERLEIQIDEDFERFYSFDTIYQPNETINVLRKTIVYIVLLFVIGVASKAARLLKMKLIGDLMEIFILISILTLICYYLHSFRLMYNQIYS